MLCQLEGVLSGSDFYFFRPSATARNQLFYFTSIGHFFCDYGYRVERQDYGNYLLLYVKKGKLAVTTEGGTFHAREGDMAFINCHLPHEYHAIGFTEFMWIHFDGSNSGQFHNDITKNICGHPVFHLEQGEHMERTFKEIISNCRYEKFCSEYDDSMNIYKMLIELCKNITGSGRESKEIKEQVVEEAISFIRQNLEKDLSVGMIAEHVGLSESHFSRKFRQAMSSSPKEYIIRRRLNDAKHLLKTTALPVKEIALSVGFNSESHFINTFTAQNGLSPKKFREFPM